MDSFESTTYTHPEILLSYFDRFLLFHRINLNA